MDLLDCVVVTRLPLVKEMESRASPMVGAISMTGESGSEVPLFAAVEADALPFGQRGGSEQSTSLIVWW